MRPQISLEEKLGSISPSKIYVPYENITIPFSHKFVDIWVVFVFQCQPLHLGYSGFQVENSRGLHLPSIAASLRVIA